MNTNAILLKILEIIGFADDKDTFVKKFMDAILLQSISDLSMRLPLEQQQEIKENINDSDKLKTLLGNHFSQEQKDQAVQAATQRLFAEYIQSINPTLSDTQRKELTDFLEQVKA